MMRDKVGMEGMDGRWRPSPPLARINRIP
jgi:hypothetical protein